MVDGVEVALVRGVMLPGHDVTEPTDVVALVGEPSRLRPLLALLEGGETCGCDLAAEFTHAQRMTALRPEQHDVSTLAGADV